MSPLDKYRIQSPLFNFTLGGNNILADEATQAIKWEYRRCGWRPAKISDEDAAILDDDGNDIFKDDNREPLEKCPECEGEKLIKLVPISQNDEVLYECTMCHYIAKIKENKLAETKITRRPLVIRECAKCKSVDAMKQHYTLSYHCQPPQPTYFGYCH
jgi:hypothetical protein